MSGVGRHPPAVTIVGQMAMWLSDCCVRAAAAGERFSARLVKE
jgi:hypothetical protein